MGLPQHRQTIERMMTRLNRKIHRHNAVIYAILFRNAGVGIQFADPFYVNPNNKYGLVVHRYYKDLRRALYAELERIWLKGTK